MELVKNPLFARVFARCGARNEERGNREFRRELLAGLSGRVLEVGAGTGLNFPHYPVSVREVVAVEPEPYLRTLAVAAAEAAPLLPCPASDPRGDRPGVHHRRLSRFPVSAIRDFVAGRPADSRDRP